MTWLSPLEMMLTFPIGSKVRDKLLGRIYTVESHHHAEPELRPGRVICHDPMIMTLSQLRWIDPDNLETV